MRRALILYGVVMKSKIAVIFSILIFSLSAFAGNGVERGSVMIKPMNQSPFNDEILKFLKKTLVRCSNNDKLEYFEISEVTLRKERIDQGIVDLFYKIKLNHVGLGEDSINTLVVEVLDSDFHNWRDYEEKLSLEILNDQNNKCL